MKRRRGATSRGGLAVVGCVLIVGACSPQGADQGPDGPPAQAAWQRPPSVNAVTGAGGVVMVRGVAEPRARVLLKSDDGAAFAASADSQGRFEIRLTPSAPVLLLRPQVQSGRDVATAPEWLLLAGGAGGVAALVTPGEPVRRLDRRQRLEAMDSDGRLLTASGTAAPGAAVTVVLGTRAPVEAVAASDGRWIARLGPPPSQATQGAAGGQAFLYPGGGGAGSAESAERAGEGWRATWREPGGPARQVWLPDGG